ncbi:MAG: 39S ribosomal protein L45 [Bacteroidales bacterium]|nr:39S ribosomal protein L45 [Bacteroidales bacterium]
MKKRLLGIILVLIICVSVSSLAAYASAYQLPLDVGNHNDYGGGDYGGGGDWGGGNDYSWSDSGSSSSGDLGSVGGGSVVVIIIVVVAFFLIRKYLLKGGSIPNITNVIPQAAPLVPDFTQRITQTIAAEDTNFSTDKFLAWSKEVFITLQNAWTERDWSKIRPFEKEELFRQHEAQLQEYINLGRINVMGRINVNQAYLTLYKRDTQFEYLTVYMAVRMTDYIIDENTKAVLKGDLNKDCYMNYLLTFMRKKGVLTNPATSNKSTVSCPHCGAPVQITSAGKCEYCDFIITTGEHDWVLSNLDSVKPNTVIDKRGVVLEDGE